MKRARIPKSETIAGNLFTRAPDNLHPSLQAYLNSTVPKTARLDPSSGKYDYVKDGARHQCGGIHRALKRIFYPNYKETRGRRARGVKVKGSSKREGTAVDRQLGLRVAGKKASKESAKTKLLINFWISLQHTLQAAQVPVEIAACGKMTKCDVITKDAEGRLWCWEVKCGFPTNLFRKQGNFIAPPFQHVECTKLNMWHLQVHYTADALCKAGVPIYQYRVIQVFEQDKDLRVRVHPVPAWLLPKTVGSQERPLKKLKTK